MNNKIILPIELINHILCYRPTHPIITKTLTISMKIYNSHHGDPNHWSYDENKSFSKYILEHNRFVRNFIRREKLEELENLQNNIKKSKAFEKLRIRK
jgi:uncharacterized protein YcbK (DUF882 family)